jgi:hypothetical protein
MPRGRGSAAPFVGGACFYGQFIALDVHDSSGSGSTRRLSNGDC